MAFAVGVLVAESTLLDASSLRTEEIIAAKIAETEEQGRILKDDYRKIAKKLGFNLLILPKDQNLSDLYLNDYASKYMPEDYVDTLAQAGILTVNHLLPTLQQRVKWPEQNRTILLMGTRGEVPIVDRDQKEPMLNAVDPQTAIIGYELHKSLGISKGDKIKLLGREFTAAKLYSERGTKDDITIWLNLGEAQDMLEKKGLINGILALSCHCHSSSRIGLIRDDVSKLLPNTQVIEFESKAITRAEARDRAAKAAKDAIASEKANRAKLQKDREGFAAILVSVIMVGCVVWIAFLSYGNVRDRRTEVGILRAVGMSSGQIMWVFLGKALLVGIVGAILGCAGGLLVGALRGVAVLQAHTAGDLIDPTLLIVSGAAAVVLALLASWIPAALAAREDPAVVLREEA